MIIHQFGVTVMASLLEKKGYFYAQFYDGNRHPRRKTITLKTRRRRVAERIYNRLEDEYALGHFDPWKDDLSEGPDLSTLEKAVPAFIDTRRNYSPHTVRKYETVLGLLKDHAGRSLPSVSLTPARIQAFLDGKKRAPDTKKSYSNQIKAFCNWLIEQGVLEENPVKKVNLPRVPHKHPQYLEPEEVDRLVKEIEGADQAAKVTKGTSKWLVPIVRTNVYLGMRLGEVVNLQWRHVDSGARRLTVANTDTFRVKGGKDRTLPICDAVYDVLESLERPCEYVFPNYGGTKLHPAYLSRRFKHYVREAGLPEHVTFHTTRHTALSWLAKEGVSAEAIRLYAGHSSISVTQKYMHLSPNAFHEQIARAFR